MSQKFLKVWYIIVGIFAAIAVVYYLVYLIDYLVNPYVNEAIKKFNPYAIAFLTTALLMLVALIPISKMIDKKQAKIAAQRAKDQEYLAKYKKKTK